MKKHNATWTIMRRELAAYFTNPAAYIVTGLYLLLAGILFFSTFFLNGRAELRNYFSIMPLLLSLFVPALTMRLFSEELRSGSFETLLTLPVTEAQIVIGKFFAAFITSAAMICPTLFYAVTARVFGHPDAGPIFCGFAGALFLCALYSAVGIFASGMTKNQIIAFFTALAISFALTLVGSLLVFLPAPLVKFFSWASATTHFQSVARGIIDTRDIIYFASFTALFLLLTVRKFVINWTKEHSIDFALAVVILALANIAAGKTFVRADLTGQKMYSLSKASKELVANLQEPLTVNAFFSADLPAPYNSVDQYMRDLLQEYKSQANKNFNYKFFDMSKEESEDAARSYGLSQTQIQKVETTEVSAKAVWMSVAIVYGDNIKTFDNINNSAGLEYKLTTAMSKMISTNDALARLNGGLELILYPADELKGYGIAGLSKLEGLAKKAVAELNKKYEGQINFKVQNATGDEATKLSEEYGIQAVNYDDPDTKENKTTALGLVLKLGDQFRIIPLKLQNFFGWRLAGAENLEESVSSSIESLLSKTVQIAYITGHDELSLRGDPYRQNDLSAENFRNALNDIYTLKEINLSDDDIPLNIKCAIVNGPKTKFTEKELRKLDQFVMAGGNLLLCLEPLVENAQGGQMPSYTKPDTGLEQLLSAYGIVPGADYVMDENCFVQNQGPGNSQKLNWAPLLEKSQLDSKSPITKYLAGMIFLQNGSIDISGAQADADLKTTVLARSSNKSWTVSENIILYPGYIFPPQESEKIHSSDLAVLVEGKFKSAYAGIAPKAEEDKQKAAGLEEGAKSDTLSAAQAFDKGIQNAKILLINSSQVTTQQLIDGNGSEPMSLFMRNAVDCLNGQEDFCQMRSKGSALNLLNAKNAALATLFKLVNQFGLTILVALLGLLVWRLRAIRRNEIRIKYNPNDEREAAAPSKTVKEDK
ncbi:MAG: Gldg family protein [Treponema sp.]|nr:Gldg family protein [Treponema sp.]